MAAKKKQAQEGPQENKAEENASPSKYLENFLKREADFHYNFEDPINYIVSSGTLIMDANIKGFGPGFYRFVGGAESGKTSEALLIMKNFLEKVDGARGIYVKSEGRLSEEVIKRSGLKFVFKAEEWEDGTVFVYESNIYESVARMMTEFIRINPYNKRYMFIIDSVDSLVPIGDMEKKFEDSAKVAGGAVIASNLAKRLAIPFTKRGHMAILISQVRSTITDPYGGGALRQIVSSGGNALLHFPEMIWQFEPRFKDDRILLNDESKSDPNNNPIIGHWVKVTVKKSPYEKSEMTFRYPVKYGRTGGESIWVEKEIFILLCGWGMVTKKTSWYTFGETVQGIVKEMGIDFPTSIQGEAAVYAELEKNPALVKVLFHYFREKIANGI